MEAQIRIAGGSGEELASLSEWLKDEEELRGRVRTVTSRPGETELGSVTDLLTVALGVGGAGTVLASSLTTWLQTRRTTAKITIEYAGRMIRMELETVGDVAPMLTQILRASDDG